MAFVQKIEELRSPRMGQDDEDFIDFIDDNAFEEKVQEQNQEAIKWKDLTNGVIYKFIEVLEVDGKFDKCKILTLKDRGGETMRVWACPMLNTEKDALQGAFVRSTGFKLSKKTKQQYLTYDLVRKKISDPKAGSEIFLCNYTPRA